MQIPNSENPISKRIRENPLHSQELITKDKRGKKHIHKWHVFSIVNKEDAYIHQSTDHDQQR